MILTLYAVDNEFSPLETIRSYVENIDDIKFIGGEQNPHKAKDFLSQKEIPDIILLDIVMGDLDGRELAKLVKGRAYVIFTTGHAEFAVESYEFNAVDYLLKPFSLKRFMEAIEKVRERNALPSPLNFDKGKTIVIKDSRTNKQNVVPLDSIQYLHSNGNYSNVYVEGLPFMLSLLSLTKMHHMLGNERFIRVHKEWVINFNQIESFTTEY